MYSPKIDPTLIPKLYQLAHACRIPMTHLVNRLLEQGIARLEQGAEHVSAPCRSDARGRTCQKRKAHDDHTSRTPSDTRERAHA